MAIKVYLNNVLVPHRDGIPITFANNEQLDSGTLVIPNLDSKLDIKRNDQIKIVLTPLITRYYLVAGYVYSLATNKNPYKYTYEITLVSYTMKLQSYLLPNITITQPLNPNEKYSIYDQANRLRYILKLQNTYSFSTFFRSTTQGVICPEFSFNRRNFWEILNTLLGVVDCVVTMDSPTIIGCRRLVNAIVPIDFTKIIDLKYHADANDFCSELEMNAENVVGDNVSTASEYWITPRSTSYVIDTDNAQLVLERNIYYINKVIINFKTEHGLSFQWINTEDPTDTGEVVYGTGVSFTLDITDWVVEETVYNTKLPVLSITEFDPDAYLYKRFFLSYREGSNTIDNIGWSESLLFNISANPAIYNIITKVIVSNYEAQYPNRKVTSFNHGTTALDQAYPDVRDILFNVDYTSLNTIRFRTKKETTETINEKVIASNRTSSYVDAKALGKSEQSNANRIGNEYYELTLKGFSPDPTKYYFYNVTGVGAFYLTKYQVRYTDIGTTYMTGIFTKKFIQKDLFTGINSKARFTSIATGNDVLLRQDIVNLKFTVDDHQTSEFEFSTLFYNLWANLGQRKKYEALVNTTASGVSLDFFKLPLATYLLGNQKIILEFRFKNNVSAGLIVDNISSNKYICKDVKYTNDNGEFSDIDFTIQPVNENESDANKAIQAKKYPIAYKNGNKVTAFGVNDTVISIDAQKDNREIYGVCVNLEIESANEHIELTEYFYENLSLVCNGSTELYIYLGEDIDETEQIYLDQDINRYIVLEGIYIQAYIQTFCEDRGVSFDDLEEWGICDGNDRKLIKVTSNSINKLYFNKE